MGKLFEVDIAVYEGRRRKPQYTIGNDLDGELSLKDLLEGIKAELIVIADRELRSEQMKGFDKDPVMLVDNKRGKDPSRVHPLGQIEFVSREDFGVVLLDAYNGLLERSKVLTGRYKASHYVFWNGVQVATDLRSLQNWLGSALLGQSVNFKDGDTIRFVNIQPYGRRLELLGVTAQRSRTSIREKRKKKGDYGPGVGVKIPNGAYQLTARSIKRKYKQNTLIRFSFLSGSQLGLTGTFKGGRRGKNSVGRPYLYPSIIFTVQERGITG